MPSGVIAILEGALPSAGGGLPMEIEPMTALVAVLITETLLDPKLAT